MGVDGLVWKGRWVDVWVGGRKADDKLNFVADFNSMSDWIDEGTGG